ncbi:CRISPR-associated endonuclease/helicase Cas3 [Desulforhopalus singaporensis]|uniref:CRISPR-associated endonuclease/helicase Cas3 n=2 Tax=Desulforhopalus singaporensis TaxID=91360 RepID=A0A1H0TVM5_9BACT|nr:CRISPR-associated endonuclease/helicase Cas3 [Desulforhopalus singaporensis]
MTYFWAKTTADGEEGISVYEHMIHVGCVAQCLAEIAPTLLERYKLSAAEIGALAALHDLGKISPGFQQKCEGWLKRHGLMKIAQNGCWDTRAETDHGKVSHAVTQGFLINKGIAKEHAKYLAAVLGAHHGRLKYRPDSRGLRLDTLIRESNSGIDWDGERQQAAEDAWNFFLSPERNELSSYSTSIIWWLAGLTTVADWIGSNERFFSAESSPQDSRATALHAIQSIGFVPPRLQPDLSFYEIFGFPPNEMQVKAKKMINGPGVYVIEAPMGMGKTEAALGIVYQLMIKGQAHGMYFALPTQATSNRIHLRVNSFLERIAVEPIKNRLIHGNSWLMQNSIDFQLTVPGTTSYTIAQTQTGIDWFASAKRALLAPFGVGTIDQALLGVVAAKHFFVRHFALAGKVVIIDEVHSYDVYTGSLIDKLISTLEQLGCTVLILSATLTAQRRSQLLGCDDDTPNPSEQPYPLISGRSEETHLSQLTSAPPPSRYVRVVFESEHTAQKEAVEVARKGGAVLWICNTVGSAQRCYRQLQRLASGEFPIGLLHSKFPHWRRETLEETWMKRFGKGEATRCGAILVSTQVVEQSVDLDSDFMISELAPTDMILQRTGRLWRHMRDRRPVESACLCIIKEDSTLLQLRTGTPMDIIRELGDKALVYAPFVLLRSLEVWSEQTSGITIPDQIRELIEKTYEEREDEPKGWEQLYNEWYGTDSAKRMQAMMNSNIWQPLLDDREDIQTRLNEIPSTSIVLCRSLLAATVTFLDGAEIEIRPGDFQFSVAKAVQSNLVRLPAHYIDPGISTNTALSGYLYKGQYVAIVDNAGRVSVVGAQAKVALTYSDEYGLEIKKINTKEKI